MNIDLETQSLIKLKVTFWTVLHICPGEFYFIYFFQAQWVTQTRITTYYWCSWWWMKDSFSFTKMHLNTSWLWSCAKWHCDTSHEVLLNSKFKHSSTSSQIWPNPSRAVRLTRWSTLTPSSNAKKPRGNPTKNKTTWKSSTPMSAKLAIFWSEICGPWPNVLKNIWTILQNDRPSFPIETAWTGFDPRSSFWRRNIRPICSVSISTLMCFSCGVYQFNFPVSLLDYWCTHFWWSETPGFFVLLKRRQFCFGRWLDYNILPLKLPLWRTSLTVYITLLIFVIVYK